MILTNEEKDRFVQWCREHISSTEAIIQQLEKMPNLAMTGLIKQQKIQVLGCSVVMTLLTNVESQTLTK